MTVIRVSTALHNRKYIRANKEKRKQQQKLYRKKTLKLKVQNDRLYIKKLCTEMNVSQSDIRLKQKMYNQLSQKEQYEELWRYMKMLLKEKTL